MLHQRLIPFLLDETYRSGIAAEWRICKCIYDVYYTFIIYTSLAKITIAYDWEGPKLFYFCSISFLLLNLFHANAFSIHSVVSCCAYRMDQARNHLISSFLKDVCLLRNLCYPWTWLAYTVHMQLMHRPRAGHIQQLLLICSPINRF